MTDRFYKIPFLDGLFHLKKIQGLKRGRWGFANIPNYSIFSQDKRASLTLGETFQGTKVKK